MNTDAKFEMLRDLIKYSQKAMIEIHGSENSYTKNIVLAFSTSKALFESLKEKV